MRLYIAYVATGFALGWLWCVICALVYGRPRSAGDALRAPSTWDGAHG